MQTFLPYPSFELSASVLDMKRLGKQRVEGYQILRALTARSKGWRQHPATRMWAGHAHSLAEYTLAMCTEWLRRGYRDTLTQKIEAIVASDALQHTQPGLPPWLVSQEHEKLCASHRANLLRKNPVFYRQFGWDEAPDLEYHWPAQPHPLPPVETIMTDEQNTAETTENAAASTAELAEVTKIKEFIAEQRAQISDAIGEKAAARAHKRLDVALHILVGNATTVARQTLYASRPRRAAKVVTEIGGVPVGAV